MLCRNKVRLQEYAFVIVFFSVCLQWRRLSIVTVFIWWSLVVTWRGEISEQAGTGIQKIQKLYMNRPPLYSEKKIGVWCAINAPREISTISGQEPRKVNSVFRSCAFSKEGNMFSICCNTGRFYLPFWRLSSQRIFFTLRSSTVKPPGAPRLM